MADIYKTASDFFDACDNLGKYKNAHINDPLIDKNADLIVKCEGFATAIFKSIPTLKATNDPTDLKKILDDFLPTWILITQCDLYIEEMFEVLRTFAEFFKSLEAEAVKQLS